MTDPAEPQRFVYFEQPLVTGGAEVPFTKSLTVFMTKDASSSQNQADKDIHAIERDSQVFRMPVNEAYFHRLRRRVAETPELANKIVVFYQDEHGTIHEVGLRFEDENRWPVGFLQETWEEETEIAKIRRPSHD